MKAIYVIAVLVVALIVGCATQTTQPTQPTAPADETPTAPQASNEPQDVVANDEVADTEEAEPAVGGDIKVLNKAFDPEELTVSAGSTVTWINTDETAVHSLSITGKGTFCPRKKAGEKCEYTFEEPGTYEVMDLINKFKGTITVTGGKAE